MIILMIIGEINQCKTTEYHQSQETTITYAKLTGWWICTTTSQNTVEIKQSNHNNKDVLGRAVIND
jgi:hypothetical protein